MQETPKNTLRLYRRQQNLYEPANRIGIILAAHRRQSDSDITMIIDT